MARYAEISNNTVIELFIPPQGFELKDCFHESLLHRFIELEEDVFVFPGYIYDPMTGEFAPPPEPKAEEPAPEPTAE